jgi:uncharacterized membrane protein YhhN
MMFSFIGDFALNYSTSPSERPFEWFLVGGVSFVAAHIFYCISYIIKASIKGISFFNVGALIVFVMMIVITIYFLVKAKEMRRSKLFIFATIYLWLTSVNYMVVISYAVSIKSIESIVALGGLSFLASDVIIGLEQLTGLKSKTARELVWWLYPIGQIILIIMA